MHAAYAGQTHGPPSRSPGGGRRQCSTSVAFSPRARPCVLCGKQIPSGDAYRTRPCKTSARFGILDEAPTRRGVCLQGGEPRMPGNNRVFISHSHDDNARCAPLLAAMDAWGVDYWFDTEGGLSAGQHLTERVQRAMAERDVFLRVCTGATQQSFWMNLETNAF